MCKMLHDLIIKYEAMCHINDSLSSTTISSDHEENIEVINFLIDCDANYEINEDLLPYEDKVKKVKRNKGLMK